MVINSLTDSWKSSLAISSAGSRPFRLRRCFSSGANLIFTIFMCRLYHSELNLKWTVTSGDLFNTFTHARENLRKKSVDTAEVVMFRSHIRGKKPGERKYSQTQLSSGFSSLSQAISFYTHAGCITYIYWDFKLELNTNNFSLLSSRHCRLSCAVNFRDLCSARELYSSPSTHTDFQILFFSSALLSFSSSTSSD